MIISNIAVLLLEIPAFYISIRARKLEILVFYTQLSNIVTAVSSMLMLVFGGTAWVAVARFLSSCMLTMTFFVTVFVLIPLGGSAKKLLFSGNGIYHHLLCPAISVFSYIALEPHVQSAAWIILSAGLTTVYGIVMLWMNGTGKYDGPYPFFRVRFQSAAATLGWMAVLIAVISALSYGIYLL